MDAQTDLTQAETDLTQAETDLAQAVAANTAASNAAAAEIGNLAAELKANSGDPAAVEAAAQAIETQVAVINSNNAALAGTAGAVVPPAAITISPETFVATGLSVLNDVIQATGGTGNVAFTGDPQNGLTVTDTGNSTAVIGGTAPPAGGNATIDVSFSDQGSPQQTGTATINVNGI